MSRVVDHRVDPVGEVLGEVVLPSPVTAEDVRLAVWAVVVHGAELWPTGPICRNDRAPFPCRLHRWGRRVLRLRGLSEAEVDAVVLRGDPDLLIPGAVLVGAPGDAPAGGEVSGPVGG